MMASIIIKIPNFDTVFKCIKCTLSIIYNLSAFLCVARVTGFSLSLCKEFSHSKNHKLHEKIKHIDSWSMLSGEYC